MAEKKEMVVEGITKKQLSSMITHWEKFASCYFWRPPGSASGRRSEEERHARDIDFTVDGVPCNYQVSVSCSCKSYYCDRDLYVDGVRAKQGLRFLRKVESNGVF